MLRPFRVLDPKSIADASADLQKYGEDAKVYAGGSELLLLIRQGFVQYDYLVNVKGIPELSKLGWNGNSLQIGSNVTHNQMERSAEVREHFPMLQDAEKLVANIRVRNIGTLGGNLCFGDPHSDPATALLVYNTQAKIAKKDAARSIPLDDFFVGLYETALEPDEVLTGFDVEPLPQGVGSAYLRVARFERPSISAAVAASKKNDQLCCVRIAIGCVGPVPIRLSELESKVEGATLEEGQRIVKEARAHYSEILEPVDDLHGSAEYKTYMVGVMLSRGLAQATGTNGGS
jgi:carbon-monoxide dehydrogenase medium subunit